MNHRSIRRALVVLSLLAMPWLAVAQDDPFQINAGQKKNAERAENVKLTVKPTEAKRGETVTLTFSMTVLPGFHTYAVNQPDKNAEAFASKIDLVLSDGMKAGKIKEPDGKPHKEEGIGTVVYLEGEVVWSWPITIAKDAKPGKQTLKAKLNTQVCDENGCLPFSANPETTLTISDAPPVEPAAGNGAEPGNGGAPVDPPGKAGSPAGTQPAEQSGFVAFLFLGIVSGGVSLLTPCVFPMIPITVSFFLKQSEKEHHKPLAMASVYSLTIVVVLTFGAVVLLTFFQRLSQHWLTNALIGALFFAFALSLFGMFEIRLPTRLANLTSAHEGQGGLMGVMFMALTFTVVSFTCVAPFLGGFAGAASAARPLWQTILGGLAFSITFASPFFFLALFPSLLRGLPKSGGWMNNVKVVMGFLELAAAIKFFRSAELFAMARYWNSEPSIFTFDVSLAAYVVLSILCGLYLLNLYRTEHDTPVEHLGALRVLIAIGFFGLAIYLMPALWHTRPQGSVYNWVGSFLLSNQREGEAVSSNNTANGAPGSQAPEKLPWIPNLEDGLQAARAKKQRIFIDFTGMS